jgi:hypothetical protein
MISTDQRKRYWAELHAVMEKVGTVAGRASVPASFPNVGSSVTLAPSAQDIESFREQFHAKHNLPASTKDFTRAHFDTFLAACAAVTKQNDLKPQLRALDQPKARLLHKILVEQAAQLRALFADENPQSAIRNPQSTNASEYIQKICADKFHGRKPSDLSADKRQPYVVPPLGGSGEMRPSELEMLMFTIARAISELRQQKGWTVHELLWQSGLGQTCECALPLR